MSSSSTKTPNNTTSTKTLEDSSTKTTLTTSQKIAARVTERNSWDTFYHPSLTATARMIYNYGRSPKPPKSEELDRVFPIHTVDWDSIVRPVDSLDVVSEKEGVVGNHSDDDGVGGETKEGDEGEKEVEGEVVEGGKSVGKAIQSRNEAIQSTWIGHASLLVQMGGWNILTDPVFGERCSPIPVGPKRMRRPAFTIKELMKTKSIPIDIVLISHNHYDHLEYQTVKKVAEYALTTNNNRPITFIVPLGLYTWFRKNVPSSCKGGNRVVELDWHESVVLEGGEENRGDVTVTGIPMQHWSDRRGYDKDKTLWCGFSVVSSNGSNSSSSVRVMGNGGEGEGVCASGDCGNDLKFLFCGDTGYFDGVNDIGKTYGPFDLAAIPIGAYEPRHFMKPAHMNPEDAVKFMTGLRATAATPIHWGTFQLTIEPVMEPRERLGKAMVEAGKDEETFRPLEIGETVVCWKTERERKGVGSG